MNELSEIILKKAEIEAVFNVYLYLLNISLPKNNQSMQEILWHLEILNEQQTPEKFSTRDVIRLKILKEAIQSNEYIAKTKILDYINSENGMVACMFIKPDNNISIAFKGTGCGEWIDNGEGLSGIGEENIYITYPERHTAPCFQTIYKDYATDQQVEALNWYEYVVSKHHIKNCDITVSGHSKGGNKAQFIAMKSEKVNLCFSFDGQGFSPEAIESIKTQLKDKYKKRRQRIFSFCAENDYVNVLGNQLVLKEQTYYFKSIQGIHYMEAMLDSKGEFNPQCNPGKLSDYIRIISEDVMSLSPFIRQYATLGIMNIFQKYIGKCEAVNNDSVSIEKTIAGISVAAGIFLNQLKKSKAEKFNI